MGAGGARAAIVDPTRRGGRVLLSLAPVPGRARFCRILCS